MVSRFRAVALVVLQMPTSPIRILAVDDHPLILNGVRDLIANHEDLVLVGEASTAKDAIEKYRGLRPDVTLMDIQMPIMDGIEATIAIRREFPTAKLIMLTTYTGDLFGTAPGAAMLPGVLGSTREAVVIFVGAEGVQVVG